jgi:hypothetical protein
MADGFTAELWYKFTRWRSGMASDTSGEVLSACTARNVAKRRGPMLM